MCLNRIIKIKHGIVGNAQIEQRKPMCKESQQIGADHSPYQKFPVLIIKTKCMKY